MTLLEIKNLHMSLKKTPILKGINLTVYPQEKLGLVGESGSGKSALAKTLLKLYPPGFATMTQGEIIYKNQNITHYTQKQMEKIRGKEIGMIFQDPMSSLNPTLKIGFQIAEGFLCHNPHITKKEAKKHTLKLLSAVGFADPVLRFNAYPHTLSGGLRQRVAIAIALAASPTLLIADEITTALDLTLQAHILNLITTLQAEKTTILITHDLSVAASFCDRLAVMYQGEIVEDAPINDIFSHPKHLYTKHLLNSIPKVPCLH